MHTTNDARSPWAILSRILAWVSWFDDARPSWLSLIVLPEDDGVVLVRTGASPERQPAEIDLSDDDLLWALMA